MSNTIHQYTHDDQTFSCQIINYPFGRVGLQVEVAGNKYYVFDTTLACPVADYMEKLCQEICEKLCQAFVDGVQHHS